MTEDEAKTKWCFAAVASHNDPRGGFHDGETPQDHHFTCIGSRCMAWRWTEKPIKKGDAIFTNPYTGYIADDDISGDGYCGLAGK